ncbi:MAG: hypothetical protein R2812_02405 [Gelidibacter sp.]
MFYNYKQYPYLLVVVFALFSCANDDNYVPVDDNPEPESPVVFDINAVPYQTLSEYNFFEGTMSDLNPVYGVLPYDLISPLFSDYAHKKRFVWMPNNVTASYVNDYSPLNFPTGAVLIKNFYYDNVLPEGKTKILETRLMIKKEEGWTFANYIWNDEQTEATFDTEGKFVDFSWTENGTVKNVNYKIPSYSECFTCHNKYDTPVPIGPKPQNLNRNIDYPDGIKNQLSKWVEMGYLTNNYPTDINSIVKWDDPTQPLEMRVRSYLDINCAHCHSEQSYCEYAHVRFEFDKTSNPVNLGVCVDGTFIFDSAIHFIVSAGNAQKSIIYNRLNTTDPSIRMPLLGRTLIHEEGVQLIEEWINSLNYTCN